MSRNTPRIFEAICLAFDNPYPAEPLNPDDWNKIELPRPCFDKMMTSPNLETDSRPDHMLFAIAKELRRRGFGYYAIEKEMYRINDHCFKYPMRRSEVRRSILGYEQTEFYHCCSHSLLKPFCVGHKKCEWIKSAKGYLKKNVADSERFASLYSTLLRTDEKRVYQWFLNTEEKHNLNAGKTIFRSYRQLALELNFKDKGIVLRACKKLEKFGLIKISYSGKGATSATGLCSGFKRISPVPPPNLPAEGVISEKF